MSYITNANAKQIIRKLDTMNFNLEGEVYTKPIYFLNNLEKQSLLGLKELFENPESFVDDVYTKIKKQENPGFVFSWTDPAYHSSTGCKNLNSEYTNYRIPEEIMKMGVVAQQMYRKWFKENYYLLEDGEKLKIDIFQERCRLKFRLTKPVEIVRYENSGAYQFKYSDLSTIEKEIDNLIKEAGRFYYQSQKHTIILKRYSKLTFLSTKEGPISDFTVNNTGYSDDEVKAILKEHSDKFKKPIMNLLREWYRVKHNPTLKFDQDILEQLGFRECSCCAKKSLEGFHSTNKSILPNLDQIHYAVAS